jgi:hypothetical protein
MKEKQRRRDTLILPAAAVIETGNHISQVSDGGLRRETALKFKELLELILVDRAPWRLHQLNWGESFLQSLVEGAETGMDLVEHAVNRVGGGDLSILAERLAYKERTAIADVRLWTRDSQLLAHD